MKYKYCPSCKKAYLKSRLEKDKCIYCGKECRIVDVKRTGLYYLGYAIIVLGAIVMLVLRLNEFDTVLIWLIGILVIIIGGMTVMAASNNMAKNAAETVRKENQTSET